MTGQWSFAGYAGCIIAKPTGKAVHHEAKESMAEILAAPSA
ncbi:hypothetical protein X735_25795 [Mesorhizobium sp. L2C085B000]|nr:hypothetical protein X735_25795 [Mesorhizobium sp. L2C085B000]